MDGSLLDFYRGGFVGNPVLLSEPVEVTNHNSLVCDFKVISSIVSGGGTFTIDVDVEDSNDLKGDDWETLSSFSQVTLSSGDSAEETIVIDFTSTATMKFVRVKITPSGGTDPGANIVLSGTLR